MAKGQWPGPMAKPVACKPPAKAEVRLNQEIFPPMSDSQVNEATAKIHHIMLTRPEAWGILRTALFSYLEERTLQARNLNAIRGYRLMIADLNTAIALYEALLLPDEEESRVDW